ncbi:MAG TPA: 3-deoxy-manno-octulosonate cytidylyltransferase [Alloacidobacterium sp.]|nr:3-deoxy-manno-octulosonate cytidylyltransferase [Alloacidobacterium sp.]
MRILGVIPARLASTRLPRKVLREIAGEPMLAWVFRAARACSQLDEVLIATDSEEVMEFARSRNMPAMLTPADCASGSDRVHVVSQSVAADVYVNIQGDEPLLRAEHLDTLLYPFSRPEVQVTTLATACAPELVHNPNAVKVVTADDGRALYFSRAAIPFDRDSIGSVPYRKHLGIYAYRKAALERFHSLPPGRLETIEKLEQLRFLENAMDIHVALTPFDTVGVDTEEDMAAVENLLKINKNRQL